MRAFQIEFPKIPRRPGGFQNWTFLNPLAHGADFAELPNGKSAQCRQTKRNFAKTPVFLVVLLLGYQIFGAFGPWEDHLGAPLQYKLP
jgi:hypothetical protein